MEYPSSHVIVNSMVIRKPPPLNTTRGSLKTPMTTCYQAYSARRLISRGKWCKARILAGHCFTRVSHVTVRARVVVAEPNCSLSSHCIAFLVRESTLRRDTDNEIVRLFVVSWRAVLGRGSGSAFWGLLSCLVLLLLTVLSGKAFYGACRRMPILFRPKQPTPLGGVRRSYALDTCRALSGSDTFMPVLDSTPFPAITSSPPSPLPNRPPTPVAYHVSVYPSLRH